jgi:hypothetical protein
LALALALALEGWHLWLPVLQQASRTSRLGDQTG